MNTSVIETFFLRIWNDFMVTAAEWYDGLMEWRLLSPTQASLLIFIVVLFFFLPIVYAWFRNRLGRTLLVELGFLSIPVSLVLLLLVPTGFAGTPDDNCKVYERGKMRFSLLDILVLPKESSAVFGDQWLILYVKNERWGNDVHQCRISLTDLKARIIAKIVRAQQQQGGQDRRFSQGDFTFSFGGRNEEPNVIIKGKKAFKKPYPPEGERVPARNTPEPPALQNSN